MKIAHTKSHVPLMNTTNHEVIASNIHCTLRSIEEYVKLINQNKVVKHLKIDHLRKKEKQPISNLCDECRDIFYLLADKLTGTTRVKHEITPIKKYHPPMDVRPYRIPQTLKPEVDRQVQKMLDEEIIRHGTSLYSAPIVVVSKKIRQWWREKVALAVDFVISEKLMMLRLDTLIRYLV